MEKFYRKVDATISIIFSDITKNIGKLHGVTEVDRETFEFFFFSGGENGQKHESNGSRNKVTMIKEFSECFIVFVKEVSFLTFYHFKKRFVVIIFSIVYSRCFFESSPTKVLGNVSFCKREQLFLESKELFFIFFLIDDIICITTKRIDGKYRISFFSVGDFRESFIEGEGIFLYYFFASLDIDKDLNFFSEKEDTKTNSEKGERNDRERCHSVG